MWRSRPARRPRPSSLTPRYVRATLTGVGAALGLWLLAWGIPALYALMVPPDPPESRLTLDGLLLALVVPIVLLPMPRGVGGLRTHASPRVRAVANLVCDLPERTVGSPTGHGVLVALVLIVGMSSAGWSFWIATGHYLVALVLLGVSLTGGWAVVLGAYALYSTGKSGRAAVAPLATGLLVAALPFGIWMYVGSVQQANREAASSPHSRPMQAAPTAGLPTPAVSTPGNAAVPNTASVAGRWGSQPVNWVTPPEGTWPRPPDAEITAVQISPTTVKTGGTIDVEITVTNTSDQPLQTQDPPPGYTYVQGQSYLSQQFASEPGQWRVAIGTAGLVSPDLPYRWGFGGDLAPGASTTVTGHIKVTSDFKPTRFWAALVQEPATLAQAGIGDTPVTASPQDHAMIAMDAANMRSGPLILSSVMGRVTYGTPVQILGQIGDWFVVKLPDGRTGWVAAGWITMAPR